MTSSSNGTASAGAVAAVIIGGILGSLCCIACCVGSIVGAIILIKYFNKQTTVVSSGMVLEPYPVRPPYTGNYDHYASSYPMKNYTPAYHSDDQPPAYPINNQPPEYQSEKSQILPPRSATEVKIMETST
ncbi:unnamed protein product [Adineta ricciae]|uniref:Uncharacterized protein n=1 Tax=Adineta ricciae TaxID=249248 RepID=A0A813SWP4_ADIRI|nr:unnamed protein product [Adineta ricciae]CAF0801462.1 unnamed protein product [Adineta ricciae]